MSILAHNGGDNRSTTGVVVALLYNDFFIILPTLQLVSLLFFCPIPFPYTDMQDSNRTLNACWNVRQQMEIWKFAPEDSAYKLDQLDQLLRRTLRTD